MPSDIELLDENALVIDMRNLGTTGLKRYAGLIFEDILPQLEGQKGIAIYKEMAANDSMAFSMLQAIDKLVRKIPWHVENASTQPYDVEAGNYLESAIDDMETPFTSFISEAMSMVPYGFSAHEIVYKRRCGKSLDPSRNSKHSDGRIAWRYLPIRSQETIFRWHFNAAGDVVAIEQQAPPNYNYVVIPMEKMLLFRTSTFKNNPMGLSILRGAYRPWYIKRGIQNVEAIGVERDLAGVPVAFVPPNIMGKNASPAEKALYGKIKEIVRNLRNDEQAGIVFPMVRDDKGNKLYELQLMTTGGTRAFDTNAIIQRYNADIAMCALADFLAVGNTAGSQGSKSMHSDKTEMFAASLASYLDSIADIMNRHAIPRLFDLNTFQMSDYPKLKHGGAEKRDIQATADFIFKLSQAGMPWFPNYDLEKYMHEIINVPAPPDPLQQEAALNIAPKPSVATQDVQEIPHEEEPQGAPHNTDPALQQRERMQAPTMPDLQLVRGGISTRAPGA